jgi:hypothetical protein
MENMHNKIDAFTTIIPIQLFNFNAEDDFWVGKEMVSDNTVDGTITDIRKIDDAMLVKIHHAGEKKSIAVNLAGIVTWNYPKE